MRGTDLILCDFLAEDPVFLVLIFDVVAVDSDSSKGTFSLDQAIALTCYLP